MTINFAKYVLLVLLITLVFANCKKKLIDVDDKQAYFPLIIGHWVLYDIDSTVYNEFSGTKYTHKIKVKELIADTFRNAANVLTYRVERWQQDSVGRTFYLKDVWAAQLINGRAEKVEENARFIKYVFPPIINMTWQGNQYITPIATDPKSKFLKNWDYKLITLDAKMNLNGIAFDSIATVLQIKEEIPQLESSHFKEIFAKNIGLVYFMHQYLEKQPNDADWKSGFVVEGTVTEWGTN
jgi:hypothetical protein